MAITQEELTQHNQSFLDFVAETNAGGVERLFPSQKNGEILKRAMLAMGKEQKLTWQELWHKRLWASIYVEHIAELESRPVQVVETEQQKWERIERANRWDGGPGNRRDWSKQSAETPAEAARRLLAEKKENEQKVLKKIEETAKAHDAQIAAETDLSVVPTVEDISQNGGLEPAAIKKLSAVQIRQYMKNVREFEQRERIRQFEESKARMSR